MKSSNVPSISFILTSADAKNVPYMVGVCSSPEV